MIAADAFRNIAKDDVKASAIIEAARKTFLVNGYDSTSMDEIALVANVSKRTVYNRFKSKEELFGAAILATCQNLLPMNIDDIEASLPPREFIYAVCEQFIRGIFEPEALALRRIATFEAGRNPRIGHIYLEHGPAWMVETCAPILKRMADRGVYSIDDPVDAIWRLGALVSEPLYTRVLLSAAPEDLDAAVADQISAGLAAFEKIYAP